MEKTWLHRVVDHFGLSDLWLNYDTKSLIPPTASIDEALQDPSLNEIEKRQLRELRAVMLGEEYQN